MKTKKCGVYVALTAALLITAALIASCFDPLSPDVLPAGNAYLTLNIAGVEIEEVENQSGTGRTILPVSPPTPVSYSVTGIPSGGGTGGTSFTKALIVTGGTGTTRAEVGTYDITVTAYMSLDSSQPVAVGTVTDVPVAAAPTTNTANVTISSLKDGDGTGTFTWSLSGAGISDADSISVALGSYTPSSGAIGANILTTGTTATGSQSLISSGTYWVTVTLSKAGHADRVKGDLVHIYDYITTPYTDSFAALVPNVYTVTFDNIDNAGDTDTLPGVTHGSTILASEAPPLSIGQSDGGTDVFKGWFKNAGCTVIWSFGASGDIVVRNTTIYAGWEPAAGEDLNINVTFTISGTSLTLTPNTATYTYAEFDASDKLIINLSAPALAPGDIVLWKLGSATLTSLNALSNILEIDPHTYPELMVAGTHVITVVIGEASGTITLTITP